jgi:uncharacterized protein
VDKLPKYGFDHLVLQPTTLCNLNCEYCYLPNRKGNNRMTVEIAKQVAETIFRAQTNYKRCITVVWHGGEPLATGLSHFKNLVEAFSELKEMGLVKHKIQTNATLINEKWCDFFKSENFSVGVSLDGPKFLNSARKNWGGEYTFSKAKQGLELLKNEDIDYYLLSVISASNVNYPHELLSFWRESNPNSVCINIEEEEGHNVKSKTINYSQALTFWENLFQSWSSKPNIRIREFDKVLSWILKTYDKKFRFELKDTAQNNPRNIWPTFSWNGDIFIISPEFMSINNSEEKEKFTVGNILNTNLNDVIKKPESIKCLS